MRDLTRDKCFCELARLSGGRLYSRSIDPSTGKVFERKTLLGLAIAGGDPVEIYDLHCGKIRSRLKVVYQDEPSDSE
jgi:hypothetical protein